MALTISRGYDGTLDEEGWSRLAEHTGARYSVGGPNDLVASKITGVDRQLSVSAGWAYGKGVADYNDGPSGGGTVTLSAPGTGLKRWDMVCLRRNWTGTPGVSSLYVVPGTAGANPPAVRPSSLQKLTETNKIDDQPLWLAQVVDGQQLVQGLVDYRLFSSERLTANSLAALPDDAEFGQEATVAGVAYRFGLLSGAPSPSWNPVDAKVTVTASAVKTIIAGSGGQVVFNMSGWASTPFVQAGSVGIYRVQTVVGSASTTQVNVFCSTPTGATLADGTQLVVTLLVIGTPSVLGVTPTVA